MSPSDADLALYADCFARNDSPRDVAGLRWLHAENPTGRCLVDLSIAAGPTGEKKLAGIYAVLPVWARIGGRRVLACQSLDTLTDVDFRGQGLFVRMAQTTYERATREGVAFVYGFPNGNSAHGFFTRLDWTSFDPVPFLARPLRTGLAARRFSAKLDWLPDLPLPAPAPRLRPGQDLRTVVRFGAEHDDLWSAFSAGIGVAIDRDARYLNWRLCDKPQHRYRIVALLERGRLLGFVAYTVSDKHGGRIGYMLELMHLPERSDAAVTLARHAVHEMAAMRADLVFAWSFPHAPNRRALTRAGFVDFPERARPVELHLGVRALAATNADRALIGDRRSWYVSYLDSDTV
jgi:GNAT superfamily N-acetyltransferase